MQVQKDYTRENIIRKAEQLFHEKGFAKTSMRDIAKASGVGLSNLYNYFKGKDGIFCQIIRPVVREMDRMIYDHHDIKYVDRYLCYMRGESDEMLYDQLHEYLQLLQRFRPQMELLLFKAHGSSMENFMDDYTDRCTQQVLRFMDGIADRFPEYQVTCHRFTYHIHTVWMFNLFCEIIKHRLRPEDVDQVITDYIKFEYNGWRELVR